MKILIEEFNFEAFYSGGIKDYCSQNNIKVEIVPRLLINRSVDLHKRLFNTEFSICIPYGSIEFIKHLSRTSQAKIWYDEKKLDFVTYGTIWNKYLLNKYHLICSYQNFKKNFEYYFKLFYHNHMDGNNKLFIRPTSNDKRFTGQLVILNDLWKDTVTDFFEMNKAPVSKDDENLILIAEPKNIDTEWRFIISDRKIVTCSKYNPIGPDEDYNEGCDNEHVIGLVEKICKERWQPEMIYVLDMCLAWNGDRLEPYIVEIGSINCAGWYGCSVEKIFNEWKRLGY